MTGQDSPFPVLVPTLGRTAGSASSGTEAYSRSICGRAFTETFRSRRIPLYNGLDPPWQASSKNVPEQVLGGVAAPAACLSWRPGCR